MSALYVEETEVKVTFTVVNIDLILEKEEEFFLVLLFPFFPKDIFSGVE